MPCILYLHGNTGNKTRGLRYWKQIVQQGFNLCVFDF
jgi:alpha/beta superfamily hydrolase